MEHWKIGNEPGDEARSRVSLVDDVVFFFTFPFQIPGLLLITHVIATVVTMTIDPAEPEVRKKGSSPPRLFDRTAHNRVIENFYCNICGVNV